MEKNNLTEFNDKIHPIEPIWVLKSTMPSLILLPFLMLLFTGLFWNELNSFRSGEDYNYSSILYLGIFILTIPLQFFANVIRRATFRYGFEGKFLHLKQGLIWRTSRQIPFGVIQNVIVKQGILDRLFGLASVEIQNASPEDFKSLKQNGQQKQTEFAGFQANSVMIPGLRKANAEQLKIALLHHIKNADTVDLGI